MKYTPKTSDAAVKKATGKTWAQWFRLLDKTGARKMSHRDIARMIQDKGFMLQASGSRGWWCQMVTVEYERSRGLRKVHETTRGFNVGVHRTFPMPVTKLRTGWQRALRTDNVLKKRGLILRHVHPKRTSFRYDVKRGEGRIIVAFASKSRKASRLAIEHEKLKSQKDVEPARRFWKAAVDRLQTRLLA